MNDRYPPSGAAVFVDGTGRRRRLLAVTGVVLGTLGFALVASVVSGLFAPTPLPAADWPGGSPTRSAVRPTPDEPARTARRTSRPGAARTPARSRPVREVSRTPQTSPQATASPRNTASPRTRAATSPARPARSASPSGRTSSTGSAPPSREPVEEGLAEPAEPSAEPAGPTSGPDPAGSPDGAPSGQGHQGAGTDPGTGE
ncbi:hypothetical protein ACFOWE_29450 [Planomonospora corallina]|uniref:Uncharacterized protein n=1 Tax=Planomonospora corallina TaxID=1806052 RepID=A0ABV8IFZ9_9ACTN